MCEFYFLGFMQHIPELTPVQPIMVRQYVSKPPSHSFPLSLVKIHQDGNSDFLISPNLIATKQKKVTQKSARQLSLKNYQQEKLSTKNSCQTISKVFATGKSTIPTIYQNRSLFFWPTFFFRNFLGVETSFFTSRAFHITRKLCRRTDLTGTVNLYTHTYCHSSFVGVAVYEKVVLK